MVSFQVLAAHLGLPEHEFIEDELEEANAVESSYTKIRHLWGQYCSFCDIEVNGGVKVGIAAKCKEAGVNLFTAASAIFTEIDIGSAIDKLKVSVA